MPSCQAAKTYVPDSPRRVTEPRPSSKIRVSEYKNSTIESYSAQDAERWAEFVVYLGHGTDTAIKELSIIYNEIQRVKEASSKLAYFVFVDTPPLNANLYFGSQITSYASSLLNTADSIVLVRDREFKSPAVFGMVVSSYKEEMLVHAASYFSSETELLRNKYPVYP